MSDKYAIILAAGKGTRMKSSYPKVVHKVLGKEMITRVLAAINGAHIKNKYVVIGHGSEFVEPLLDETSKIVFQEKQLGTGHAVLTALQTLSRDLNASDENAMIIVSCGDTPLIKTESFTAMMKQHEEKACAVSVMTTIVEQPTGYGRIIKDGDSISAIIEEKDASDIEKQITEINVGTYCFDLKFLLTEIHSLTTNNAQGEFYLTDLLKIAYQQGKKTSAYCLEDSDESLGVNNRMQLAHAEKILQKRINTDWMRKGVTLQDPENIFITDDVQIGQDTIIESNVHLLGHTRIGSEVIIESGSRLIDAEIDDYTRIRQSVIQDATVGKYCSVGPFAQLRPGTILKDHVKVGNFVEVKNSNVSDESKISHHTYIGDADIGARVNIGCGTITCNYDGKNKYRTVIGDDAFIGSNTNLIAPIKIGEHCIIGAGSTLSKNVESAALAFTRPPLVVKENWKK